MKYNKALKLVKMHFSNISHFNWKNGNILEVEFKNDTPSIEIENLDIEKASEILYHSFFTPGSLKLKAEDIMQENENWTFTKPKLEKKDKEAIKHFMRIAYESTERNRCQGMDRKTLVSN